MHSVRLLLFAADSGAGNMARDEALLLSAADRGVATLRFYTWTEPTLTLGYFQAKLGSPLPAAGEGLGVRGNLPWVRRSTGGAAIVHDPPHEITYSLALPPGAHWQPPGESWVCRMHYVIRDVLKANWGVTAKAVVCGEERKLGEVLCFLHHTPGDLVIDRVGKQEAPSPGSELRSRSDLSPASGGEVGCHTATSSPTHTPITQHLSPASGGEVAGCRTATPAGEGVCLTDSITHRHKIAGSAQRKWKGALLQHGSVLLGRSPFAPTLPGIAELSRVSVPLKELAAAVVERLAVTSGWRVEPGEWTADELRTAAHLTADKYTSAEWNEKR